ncbi:MAG: ABC transporter substrate-binding protein [Pseudomonadota bacterium]
MKHVGRLARTSAVALLCSTTALFAMDFSEAPMLTEMVEAGQLPPVEERLPANPEVITPIESVGVYGGTIRRALGGSNDHNSILRFVGPQGLVRWNPEFTAVVPNVAEAWEVNEDATEFTFTLREGMKWSDGEPFTADDVMFFVEDLLNNEEFYPNAPARFAIEGERMQAEKIDDTTVRFTFAGPYGTFMNELATPLAQEPVIWAKHYCQQFHPTYNPNVQDLVDATEAVEDWAALFRLRCGEVEAPNRWSNPDRPTLDPWVVTEQAYTAGATQVVMERNPYFWQVDTEGNQLPYIDVFNNIVSQDNQALLLEAIAGNIDLQRRRLDGLADRPVIAENRDAGGYEFYNLTPSASNDMAIHLNMTHKDPDMRAAINDRSVREALSIAIDREEIIDIVYQGVGEPWQIGAVPEHPLYNEQLGRQHTEYDPDRANELLDAAGLDQRDGEGFRLLPNGERFAFNVNYSAETTRWGDALEIIREQWQEIGVDVTSSGVERSIYYSRGEANEHDFMVWTAPGGLDPTLSPRNVMAVHPQASWFAIPWTRWYLSGGTEGEEPPASMQRRYELFEEYKATGDPARQQELFAQIHQIAADEFEVIGITKAPQMTGVKNTRLRNVPGAMPASWMYPDPAPTLPQTYFFAPE